MNNINNQKVAELVATTDSVYVVATNDKKEKYLIDVLGVIKSKLDKEFHIAEYGDTLKKLEKQRKIEIINNCPAYSEELMKVINVAPEFKELQSDLGGLIPEYEVKDNYILPCMNYEEEKIQSTQDAEKTIFKLIKTIKEMLKGNSNPNVVKFNKSLEKCEGRIRESLKHLDTVYFPYIKNVKPIENKIENVSKKIDEYKVSLDDINNRILKVSPYTDEVDEYCKKKELFIDGVDLIEAIIKYHELNAMYPDQMIEEFCASWGVDVAQVIELIKKRQAEKKDSSPTRKLYNPKQYE